MGTERSSIGTSSTLNMKNHSKNLDYLSQPHYGDTWRSENKTFYHNSQFLEGEYWRAGNHCATDKPTRNLCSPSDESTRIKNHSNQKKPGDWKHDEGWIGNGLTMNVGPESTRSDWKCKNLYSMSDFDRSDYLNPRYFPSEDRQKKPDEKKEEKRFLQNFREYLVNYQESCGVPRTEYSFAALILVLGKATGRFLLALLYVMIHVAPVIEIFLYVLRFALDKVVSISEKKDFQQMTIQYVIFAIQLLSVYVCLIFIFGFIVLPTVQVVIGIIYMIVTYS